MGNDKKEVENMSIHLDEVRDYLDDQRVCQNAKKWNPSWR